MGTEPSLIGDQSPGSTQKSIEIQATASDSVGRNRWLAALVTGLVLVAGGAAIVMYFDTPRYEARAILSIKDNSPFVAFAPRDTGDESRRYVQSQIELLRSPIVLEPVLSRTEIAALRELTDARDRVQYLHDRITIDRVNNSDLYAVAFKSATPQNAAKIVNAVIAVYLTTHAGEESGETQRVIDILEEERRRRGLDVERLRRRVVDLSFEVTGKDPFGYGVQKSIVDPSRRTAVLFEKLTDLDLDREALNAEILYLEKEGAANDGSSNASTTQDLRSALPSEIDGLQVASEDNEAIVEQIKRTDDKWSDNPLYVRLDKAVKEQRAAYDRIKKRVSESPPIARPDNGKESSENFIAAKKLKLAGVDRKRQLLSGRLADKVKSLQSGSGKLIELEFARAELAREEKVFELIANRKLALQTELRAPSRVILRQMASVPVEADMRIHSVSRAVACIAALLVPFAFAIAWHHHKG